MNGRTIARLLFILTIVLITRVSNAQYIDIDYPTGRICPGDEVNFINNSVNPSAHQWLWTFCKANPNDPPSGDEEINWDLLIKSPTYLSLNEFDNKYYVFINNYNSNGSGNDTPGTITRYTYNELNETPIDYIELNIPNMPKNLEGLQIVYDDYVTHQWYGFIVGGRPSTRSSYLGRIDFGTDLNNPNPTLTMLIEDATYNDLNFPHDLYVFYDEDNSSWHGFTVNKGLSSDLGSVSRFDFTNGINQTPQVTNIGNPGNLLDSPVGIFPISEFDGTGNNWHVFITDRQSGLKRLDFGYDLLNPAPSCTDVAVNTTQSIVNMRDISLFRSCDEIYGYIVSGENSSEANLVLLRFDDLTMDPICTSYGTLGDKIGYGHSISEVFRVDDDYYAMICNFSSQNITRLILPSCEAVNHPVHVGPHPPAIIYDESGWKQVEIITDFGTPMQENKCIDIFVDYLPFEADTINGPLVVCPGDTVIYFVDPVSYTNDYHWDLDGGMTGVSATNLESIEIAISTSISPGEHTIEVYGENECGLGPSHFLEMQVDTATAIYNHPINLLAVDLGDAAQFAVLAEGTGLQYRWEESTDGGVTWNALYDAFPYSGVYTNTLVITDVQSDMTGYEYRCIVQGSCAPIEVVSGECILVVGALLTTVGDANAEACPDVDVDIPVKVVGFSAVDEFEILFTYHSDLEYLGFNNVHDQLSGLNVENPVPGTLKITWSSSIPETILLGKMVNLMFHTNVGAACDFAFDESNCNYYSATTKLDDEYQTYTFTILPLPATPASITGEYDRCEGRETLSYEIPTPLNTDSYSWEINPPEAGFISGTTNPVSVTWDEYFHGETWIKVKGNNGCGEGSYGDSLRIVTNPLPLKAGIPSGDTNLCMAGPATEYLTVGADYATEYSWSVIPPEAGTVSGNSTNCLVSWDPHWVGFAEIHAMSVNGCGNARENSDPILVDVNPLPDMDLWASDTVIYLDAPVSFNADVWQGDAPYSYHWDFMAESWYSSRADTTIIPEDPYHEYELIVVDSNNCVMTKTIGVKILLPMFIPNAFTPDQNGLNDNFKAFITGNVEGVRYRMFVYSRNGQQVFYEEGQELALMTGWDGTVNGEYLPSGVYVYYIFYEIMGYDGREGEQLLKGSFTLLR